MTQLIPLMRANWVIALRGLTTITDLDETEAIPHFMLPSLGGARPAGFPDFRFRDRHRLVMNAELRWTPRFLDMAVFYDAGKVAARKSDLDFRDLEIRWDRHADHWSEGARSGSKWRTAGSTPRVSSSAPEEHSNDEQRKGDVRGWPRWCAVAVAAAGRARTARSSIATIRSRIVDAEDASDVQGGNRSGVRHAREPVLLAGDQTPNVRAQNLNTIDEVPDSAWFTNRLGTGPRHGRRARQGPRDTGPRRAAGR